MNIKQALSPNYNDRKNTAIDMLVLHYTDTTTLADTLEILQNPDNEVSAHYLIDEDGTIYQMVDEKYRAWHAGKAYWNCVTDVNAHSIGIEIQNNGHGHGYKPFPDVQMRAVLKLCKDIVGRHSIKPSNVVAHSDIAPDRKKDPGELFDWQLLADNGIGVSVDLSITFDKNIVHDENTISEMLDQYGYGRETSFSDVLTAFQRHFEQDSFIDGKDGQVTNRTHQILKTLLEQKDSEII